MFKLASLTGSKVQGIAEQKQYLPKMVLPMSLMYGQPNNISKYNLKMEDISSAINAWIEIMTERTEALNFVMDETLKDIKGFFAPNPKVSYEINTVPYTTLAEVNLPNVIGLKGDLKTYSVLLKDSLEIARSILEFELPALTKVVAQLIANPNEILSMRPIAALTEIKMYTQDVERIKTEVKDIIDVNKTHEFIKFGSIYYSLGEWKNTTKVVFDMSRELKKIKVLQASKDIKNLTALMDRLILRTRDMEIPKANIDTYCKVIETSSNNIAFAGAIINLCEGLMATMQEHEHILLDEIEDYKLHQKKKA